MQKILVFTDIHFVLEGQQIIGLDPVARFRQGLDHALAAHPDAARIVITGDLAHHGRSGEYARLSMELQACPLPVDLMIGNHDSRSVFRAAFPKTPVDGDGFVQSGVDLGNYRLIFLDTVNEAAEVAHSGVLCPKRLKWLNNQLDAADDKSVILFLHHPPILTGFPGMDRIGLTNRTELAQFLRQYDNVVQIIGGHVHRTISGGFAGIPTAVFKSTCHQMPMELKDEGSHLSVDEPGAYGLLLLEQSQVIVHTEDFTLPPASIKTYHHESETSA